MKLIRTLALFTASTARTTTAPNTPALAQDRPTYQDNEWAGRSPRAVRANRSALALVDGTRLAAWRLRRAQATGRTDEAILAPTAQRLLTSTPRWAR